MAKKGKEEIKLESGEAVPAEPEDKNEAAGSPPFKFIQQAAPPDETYADGALGVMSRGMIFKMDLYRVVGTERETGEELRSNSHRIVLPITAAPQLIGILQKMLQGMEESGALKREAPSNAGS